VTSIMTASSGDGAAFVSRLRTIGRSSRGPSCRGRQQAAKPHDVVGGGKVKIVLHTQRRLSLPQSGCQGAARTVCASLTCCSRVSEIVESGVEAVKSVACGTLKKTVDRSADDPIQGTTRIPPRLLTIALTSDSSEGSALVPGGDMGVLKSTDISTVMSPCSMVARDSS